MRTPALAAAATVLIFGIAGCSGIPIAPPAGTPTPVVTESPTSAATESPTAAATESPAYGTTATPTAGARVGQATANEVGQTFVRAFGNGDADAVCAVMATETAPIATDQAALEQCAGAIQGLMDLIKEQASQLQNATVSGATVSGNTATFANATVTPGLAKQLLGERTAVRINDKWYINS